MDFRGVGMEGGRNINRLFHWPRSERVVALMSVAVVKILFH